MKNNRISDKDFVLVQQNEKLHDVKFETKPTTYFKDAMKRFVKNKSSVAAGIIIGILILMAIIVPIVNTNDITTPQEEFRFLPPRWRGFENSSIFNGRKYVKDVVYNDVTADPEEHGPVGYVKTAIVGEVEVTEGFTNNPSIYAKGGHYRLESVLPSYATGLKTNFVYANFSNEFHLEVEFDTTLNSAHYELFAVVHYRGRANEGKHIVLKERSRDYGVITVPNISGVILDNRPSDVVGTSFDVQVGVYVAPSGTDEKAVVYLKKLVVSNVTNPDATNPFAKHNFDDANEMILRRGIDEMAPFRYQIVIGGTGSVYQAVIKRASFEYDFYEAVFGKTTKVVSKTTLDEYKAKGWIDFTFVDGDADSIKNSLVILDHENSPLVEILESHKRTALGKTAYEYTSIVINYRYSNMGFDEIPFFIFGTNQRGQDFFKIVFNGLRTSLILGFGAAAINIIIGLVWGAISGYYGGNIDIAMERFTEILGGVPWIIVMTLTILHFGTSLGVFLLALILTGWIGVASVTRSQFYRYKRREYVLASRTLGAKDSRLIFKHILPNSIGPIVTGAVMMIPGIIFSEATISYLGLGLQGMGSLGVALSEVQANISDSPYLVMSGSIVIALLMISFNLFGNGLRDAFNPSLKGVE